MKNGDISHDPFKVVYGGPVVAIFMDQPLHFYGYLPFGQTQIWWLWCSNQGFARWTSQTILRTPLNSTKDILFCDRNSLVVVWDMTSSPYLVPHGQTFASMIHQILREPDRQQAPRSVQIPCQYWSHAHDTVISKYNQSLSPDDFRIRKPGFLYSIQSIFFGRPKNGFWSDSILGF